MGSWAGSGLSFGDEMGCWTGFGGSGEWCLADESVGDSSWFEPIRPAKGLG